MNPDQEIIQSAYTEAIKRFYASFITQYTDACADAEKLQEAEQHFIKGVDIARQTRTRAIALLA
jgi:ABC-type transporter MlaC component